MVCFSQGTIGHPSNSSPSDSELRSYHHHSPYRDGSLLHLLWRGRAYDPCVNVGAGAGNHAPLARTSTTSDARMGRPRQHHAGFPSTAILSSLPATATRRIAHAPDADDRWQRLRFVFEALDDVILRDEEDEAAGDDMVADGSM